MAKVRWFVALGLVGLSLGWGPPTNAEDELERERRGILSLIGPRSGEVVADVGCGKGTWTFPLAKAVGAHGLVYAVDIDPRKVDEVERRKRSMNVENVRVIHSVPDDPMLPKDAMDVVFVNDVIDHVERSALTGFLDGIRSALKPAGRLIIRDPNGNPDRVISECYRAGFTLIEAKIPLHGAPARTFKPSWYALKLRKGDELQHPILPRLGEPSRFRLRLHLAEELFRQGVITRRELRSTWETIQNRQGAFDPERDEARDLIAAARCVGVLTTERAEALRKRVDER